MNKSSKDNIGKMSKITQMSNQISKFNTWKLIASRWILRRHNINVLATYFKYLIRQFNSTSEWDLISAVSSNFEGCWFWDKRSEKKNTCAARESGSHCKTSPVGSMGKSLRKHGYFAVWIAQNIALLALQQQTVTKAYTRNQHFWQFGCLSLGSPTGIPDLK